MEIQNYLFVNLKPGTPLSPLPVNKIAAPCDTYAAVDIKIDAFVLRSAAVEEHKPELVAAVWNGDHIPGSQSSLCPAPVGLPECQYITEIPPVNQISRALDAYTVSR